MAPRPKELWLGLVCYGGSSLSIYMHGVTKEINRLVKASVVRRAGQVQTAPTEQAYGHLLGQLVKDSGPDLQVIVDAIAGTSAGGINGIYLAKALALNRSQDELRKLWFDRGDMNKLLLWPRWAIFPRKLAHKVPFLIPRALKKSPLNGKAMAQWLYRALVDMDAGQPSPPSVSSLLPQGHPLDLFVTITDFYGYQRWIALDRPRFVPESRHRHVLDFHYRQGGTNNFGDNAGLAFAARTTSSFPAVFPPVSLADVSAATGGDLATLRNRCFRIYDLNDDDPSSTYFVDGGVLDNKPFGWVIDTIIRKRPAEAEVDRKLLYIEPDPHGLATTGGGESPDTLHAAMGALTTIPRSEPILDDLLEVQEHNEQVRQIRDVIETNFDRVRDLVDEFAPPGSLTATPPAQWPWTEWNDEAHAAAMTEAGMTYATYIPIKVSSVVVGMAASINRICNYPTDSNHAALVRATVRAWAHGRGLFGVPPTPPTGADPCAAENAPRPKETKPYRPSDDQVAFLRAFDLGFPRRRIRFIIAAFNWWYRCVGEQSFPSRADLDDGKAILYDAIEELDALAELEPHDDALPSLIEQAENLREGVRGVFNETELAEFLAEHGINGEEYARQNAEPLAELFADLQALLGSQLPPIARRLLAALSELTSEWDQRRRRDLVVRYLGFPIWDVLLYPIESFAQIGEGDDIDVIRISPLESELLPAAEPVEGVKLGHFFAFFRREARENDYLRGRLDAAEQLIRLLLRTTESSLTLVEACKPVFKAILTEDGQDLTSIGTKVAAIDQQVDGL